MQALFVHGMGRSPLSALPLLRRLKQNGITPHWYFYSVTFQSFPSISDRLERKIERLAAEGDYVLIGHSLGGVLIRDAVAALPAGTRMPTRIFFARFTRSSIPDRESTPAKLVVSTGDPRLRTVTGFG